MGIHADIAAFGRGWTRCRGESEGFDQIGNVGIATFPKFGLVTGRSCEILGSATEADVILDMALRHPKADVLWLAIFANEHSELEKFERAGFAAFRQDWLMVLNQWTGGVSSGDAALVMPGELAALPSDITTSIRPAFFDEPSFRLAAVRSEPDVASWGRSAAGDDATTVIDTMMTRETHRRRGFGGQVLARLLADGAADGRVRSVLVATDDGRALYETFGYRVRRSCFCLKRHR